jgi:hypothetical protein
MSYWFAARDEAAARSMADAMAVYGFAEVKGCPTRDGWLLERGMGWELVAFDGSQHAVGNLGLQQKFAVSRGARAIARAHGGFATGQESGTRVQLRYPGQPPVLRQTSGSGPVVPPIPDIDVPPPGELALIPDVQTLRPPCLDGLGEAEWSGDDYDPVPDHLAKLAYYDEEEEEDEGEEEKGWGGRLSELYYRIMPQGTCLQDAGPAVTVLARLLMGDAFVAVRRCGIYEMLITLGSRYADAMVVNADIVAATGRPFDSLQWVERTRDAVAAEIPALLARWEIEPQANRFALAVLAAMFPRDGQVLADRVVGLAADLEGTRAGLCARIASQLLAGDVQQAAENAAVIDLWGGNGARTAYDIGDELVDRAMLAQAVLAGQVSSLLWLPSRGTT